MLMRAVVHIVIRRPLSKLGMSDCDRYTGREKTMETSDLQVKNLMRQ